MVGRLNEFETDSETKAKNLQLTSRGFLDPGDREKFIDHYQQVFFGFRDALSDVSRLSDQGDSITVTVYHTYERMVEHFGSYYPNYVNIPGTLLSGDPVRNIKTPFWGCSEYIPTPTDPGWYKNTGNNNVKHGPILFRPGDPYLYRFTVDIVDIVNIITNLDNKVVCSELRQLFANNGIPLSGEVSVRVNRPGFEWLIIDDIKKEQYKVAKVGNPLKIYIKVEEIDHEVVYIPTIFLHFFINHKGEVVVCHAQWSTKQRKAGRGDEFDVSSMDALQVGDAVGDKAVRDLWNWTPR